MVVFSADYTATGIFDFITVNCDMKDLIEETSSGFRPARPAAEEAVEDVRNVEGGTERAWDARGCGRCWLTSRWGNGKPREGARMVRAGSLTRDSGGTESAREDEPEVRASGDGDGRNTARADRKR